MVGKSLVKIAESIVQAYSDKNWGELWSLVDPGLVYDETATQRKVRGVKGFMTILQEWGTAFPDSKITITGSKSYGNTVAMDLRWTGTHTGRLDIPGGEILPTGKKVDLPASMVIEIGKGEVVTRMFGEGEVLDREVGPPRAVSIVHYFDVAVLEKQLELTPKEKVA